MRPAHRFQAVYFFCVFFLSACASSPTIQPQINSLVIAQKYPYALHLLTTTPQAYGARNQLLYLLDYAMVLHLAGQYQQSINEFEKAKKVYDDLYTISLSNEVATWLINDNISPYRGEDFERVMMNVYQALNFALLGDIEEALVDAREVDLRLKLINDQYSQKEKNAYQDDAFARLLMGIFYESSKDSNNLYDALISYLKALETYSNEYKTRYGVDIPDVLKENAASLAAYLKDPRINEYKNILGNIHPMPFQERRSKAQVYFIQHAGLSPIKQQIDIPIPLPNGILTKLAFPYYDMRSEDILEGEFKAVGANNNIYADTTQTVEDIGAIAIENLNNRKLRVISKAVVRAGLKVGAEHFIRESLSRSYHNDSSRYFSYIASLYNLASEQADLRSWQTLPDKIQISRLVLDPGRYDLFFNNHFLKNVDLKAGDVVFTSYRSTR
jgi:hypothetical protein